MIDFSDPAVGTRRPLITSGNITSFTSNGVIGLAFEAFDITKGTILQTAYWKIYLASSKLYFLKEGGLFGTDGVWSCSISANTKYQCAIEYDHNSNESDNPVIYLNGVSQTVTEELTPDTLTTDAAGLLYIGGNMSLADMFQGEICDVWLYQGSMTAAQLTRATTNRLHGYSLQFANTLHNWWMSEFAAGVGNVILILPDSDVATPWNSCTYTQINSSDDTRAHAGRTDDNEEFQFGFGTDTIVSGETAIAFEVGIEGYGDKTPTYKYKRGGDAGFTTLAVIPLTGSEATYYLPSTQVLTQTQIDGMQGSILTPTMGSGDDIYIDYVQIKIASTRIPCYDRKKTGLLIGSTNFNGVHSDWMSFL